MAEGLARVDALIERFVSVGYVDDESFARARSGALLRRGFGSRRISETLGAAGIEQDLRERVMPGVAAQRRAALAMVRKRRFGPFAEDALPSMSDPHRRQKQMAAMLRAGHAMDAVRALLGAATIEDAERWVEEAASDDPDQGDEGAGRHYP